MRTPVHPVAFCVVLAVFVSLIQPILASQIADLAGGSVLTANAVGFCFASVLACYSRLFLAGAFGLSRSVEFKRIFLCFAGGLVFSSVLISLLDAGSSSRTWIVYGGIFAAVLPFNLLALLPSGAETKTPNGQQAVDSLALAIVAFAIALMMSNYLLNMDTSWYLHATRKWLNGLRLYHDFMEINPPLAFYLTAPAIFVADWIGSEDRVAFVFLLYAVAALSLIWTRALLARAQDLCRVQKGGLLIAAAVSLLLGPIEIIGQREHIAVICSLPYLLALSIQPKGLRLTRVEWMMLALFAWFGLALKPFFFLMPLSLSFAAVIQTRRWSHLLSSANLVLAALCLAYLIFIDQVHPLYLAVVVPFATEVYYAYDNSWLWVLNKSKVLGFLALALFLRSVALDRSDRAVLIRFLVWSAAGLLIYGIQLKGWDSHTLPFTAAVLLTVGWLATSVRGSPLTWAITGFIGFVFVLNPLVQGVHKPGRIPRLVAYLSDNTKGATLVSWTSELGVSFPLVNASGAVYAGRYHCQWLLPGAVATLASPACGRPDVRQCVRARLVLDYARRTSVDDLIRFKPATVFVDNRTDKPNFGGIPFDYLDFFSQDPRFADEWANYRKVDSTPRVDVWRRLHDEDGGS